MDAENLVVLKEGVKTFTIDNDAWTYKPNTFYRAIPSDSGVVVNGVDFKLEYYNEVFETVQDLILREFEKLGVIVNGKIISKKAFKEICHVNLYGSTVQRGFQIAYICSHPKELMYVFMPYFKHDTKGNTIKNAYQFVLDIMNEDMDCVENNLVQRTNTGLPLKMGYNHVFNFEDKTNNLPVI